MTRGVARVIIIEIKCAISVMCLNHPETIPHPVHGKTVLHKTRPWCQKDGRPLLGGKAKTRAHTGLSAKISWGVHSK